MEKFLLAPASYLLVLCNHDLLLVHSGYKYEHGAVISTVFCQLSNCQHCETVSIIFLRALSRGGLISKFRS
jgi:hypothetical protein